MRGSDGVSGSLRGLDRDLTVCVYVLAGRGIHDPRHHLQGGVLLHDRLGTRLPGLHQRSADAEPRVRLSRLV